MFQNIPEVKLGIIAVSRDCFPITLSEMRRSAIVKVYGDGRVRETTHDDSRCIYDMVSLLLYSRSFDTDSLTVGDRMQYPMVTGVKVEEQQLVYLGKEEVETLSGESCRCQVFSLVQKRRNKRGHLVDSEVVRFYATDDERHLPIQLDLILKFGAAKAKIVM